VTYEAILARAPLSTAAGNRPAAAAYVVFLTNIIEGDRETFAALTPSQQGYVYKLRSKWQARALGQDARWEQFGSRPGQFSGTRQTKKKKPTRHDPGEDTPLFQSLLRKYGQPRDLDSE
jgi:hypothetical protein